MSVSIHRQWLNAKKVEQEAQKLRRDLEDKMIAAIELAEDFEGTRTLDMAEFKVKITGRMNRKVDSDKVQELAAEHGLTDHLSTLFRWRPEINMSAWKHTDEAITGPLLDGITTTPGRPSFNITEKE
tara:strand:- start:115 stop:495 length:381 start_codon:yes stop_codon:yes gene_type:complete